MKTIKKAIMIVVSHKDWNWPKSILMATDAEEGRLISETAKEAFEKYKATQENKDITLLSYTYHGDVEIFE